MSPRHPGVANIDSARLQGFDPRTRMLLQRPPVPGNIPQQLQSNQIIHQRMVGPRTQVPEQYDPLQQRFPGKLIITKTFGGTNSLFTHSNAHVKLSFHPNFFLINKPKHQIFVPFP